MRCPHCNHSESKILSRHMNANEASDAVSVANVPSEIRDQLRTWVENERQLHPTSQSEPVDGPTILSMATDEDGFITVDSLKMALRVLNFTIDAESFAEQASAEGELLRVAPNRWKRA
ncbi:MAG: hypothetical protein NZ802_02275 [Candidatus Poseidoniales archaeon]|nr:hypothetical protein [Candidatus Poseidoniales archaeon]